MELLSQFDTQLKTALLKNHSITLFEEQTIEFIETILKYAQKVTLVFGEELCSFTSASIKEAESLDSVVLVHWLRRRSLKLKCALVCYVE